MSVMASTIYTKLQVLADAILVGEVLAGTKVHLFANNIVPNQSTTLALLTEATYTGYAPVTTGAWGGPYVAADGLAHVTAPSIQFMATDGATPNTIYGWFVTNTAGTILLFSAALPSPVPLIDTQHAVIILPDFVYGP